MLTSAALVLLMTPGLALFYGGMVRAKSVLNMMMMSFGALALVSVLWVLYGYSVAFGNDITGVGLLGNPTEFLGLKGLMADDPEATYPVMAFVAFQAVFAIITVALISGAIADRAKFSTWMIFVGIWVTIVYFPIAHWVFDFTLTDDADVRMSQSIMDYIFRRLALDYLDFETRQGMGVYSADERQRYLETGSYEPLDEIGAPTEVVGDLSAPEIADITTVSSLDAAPEVVEAEVVETKTARTSAELLEQITGTAVDSPLCMTCGTKMRPAGSCYVCEGCGSTSGCS
jgi:hypothetical protein